MYLNVGYLLQQDLQKAYEYSDQRRGVCNVAAHHESRSLPLLVRS